jgi:hypothetical protein
MNRPLLLSLLMATVSFGCGLDSAISPDTGTLVIRLLWGIPESVAPTSIDLAPADTAPGTTVDTLDAARIHIVGPTNRTLHLSDAGDHFIGVVEHLQPGSYTLGAEGLMSGETAYYGEARQVQVQAGTNTGASISVYSFQPSILELDSATTALRFALTYSSVQNADSYLVEIATDADFQNAYAQTTTDTAVVLAVAGMGSHFIRVRADNAFVSGLGRASETESVEIVTDVSASGDDAETAAHLGFGVDANQAVNAVNILPIGDRDWFAVDVCALDTLNVETFAQRLAIPSDLDTFLQLYDSTGTTVVAENDDIDPVTVLDSRIESIVSDDGTYFIEVSGFQDGSVGAYQLSIEVLPGPHNTGSGCM